MSASRRQSCDELRNARDDVQDELDALREEYQKVRQVGRMWLKDHGQRARGG